jgi:hypothetical protein
MSNLIDTCEKDKNECCYFPISEETVWDGVWYCPA